MGNAWLASSRSGSRSSSGGGDRSRVVGVGGHGGEEDFGILGAREACPLVLRSQREHVNPLSAHLRAHLPRRDLFVFALGQPNGLQPTGETVKETSV